MITATLFQTSSIKQGDKEKILGDVLITKQSIMLSKDFRSKLRLTDDNICIDLIDGLTIDEMAEASLQVFKQYNPNYN